MSTVAGLPLYNANLVSQQAGRDVPTLSVAFRALALARVLMRNHRVGARNSPQLRSVL